MKKMDFFKLELVANYQGVKDPIYVIFGLVTIFQKFG